jgi:hypothetical protein
MSVWQSIRKLLNRAKEEAVDVAQMAKIKLDIRSLEGHRDQLFRDIGRKVYEQRGQSGRLTQFDAQCGEIDTVEGRIREKQDELKATRGRPEQPATANGPAT